MKPANALLVIPLALAAATVYSHDVPSKKTVPSSATAPEEKPFGRAGNAKQITRSITITMSDKMRFTPGTLTVKRGETIRLIVKNNGTILHELVLGTLAELKEHAGLMKQFPGMEHDEPHMVHVAPGKAGPVIWQFTQPGEFYFACLIAGHFEAGMIGKIIVKP